MHCIEHRSPADAESQLGILKSLHERSSTFAAGVWNCGYSAAAGSTSCSLLLPSDFVATHRSWDSALICCAVKSASVANHHKHRAYSLNPLGSLHPKASSLKNVICRAVRSALVQDQHKPEQTTSPILNSPVACKSGRDGAHARAETANTFLWPNMHPVFPQHVPAAPRCWTS